MRSCFRPLAQRGGFRREWVTVLVHGSLCCSWFGPAFGSRGAGSAGNAARLASWGEWAKANPPVFPRWAGSHDLEWQLNPVNPTLVGGAILWQGFLGFRPDGVWFQSRIGFNHPTGKALPLGSQYTAEIPQGWFQYSTRKVGLSSGRWWRWSYLFVVAMGR